jgi:hypothetical protein
MTNSQRQEVSKDHPCAVCGELTENEWKISKALGFKYHGSDEVIYDSLFLCRFCADHLFTPQRDNVQSNG